MAFTINSFRGSVPRVADHLLSPGVASYALDCRLDRGQLDSWREPKLVRKVSDTKTVIRFGCCWLDFPSCVDAAKGPVTCTRLFVTGWQPYPTTVEADEDCNLSYSRLGVPCPDRAPTVNAQEFNSSAPEDLEGRSYAYQYVNAHGEKGALSNGSPALNIRDGQTVIVSGWRIPDESWGITHVAIYRTVSGHQTGREAGNTPSTVYMLVDTVPINSQVYVDKKYNEDLSAAVEEDVATPPPENLQGITWIESINTLAGFVGNRIYFSENNKYHHWPYFMDLDDDIRGITESNGQIYVATNNRPYVISGAADCENAGCRRAVRLAGEYPMSGKGNRRIAATSDGAVYPSRNGLVLLSGSSRPTLISWGRYAPEDWHQLHPMSLIPVEHGGKLFVFGQGDHSFVMTPSNGAEGGWNMDDHSEISDNDVIDAFTDRGELYILKADGLYQWDRGEELRPHLWVSSEHVSPAPVPYSAANLFFQNGEEKVTITADGREVLSRNVLSSRVFRLPTWAEGSRWVVLLQGTARVSLFTMAAAMSDLRA